MSIIYINPYQFAAAAGGYDSDAQDFINRVISADVAAGNTSGLEVGVQDAYNDFFVGCKADGNFNALKAACSLKGAQTLPGALVPLVSTMPAPTNYNFVAGDYDRKTGLKGNGTTKYLDSNRNANAQPQNSFHFSVFATDAGSGNRAHISTPYSGSINSDLSDILATSDNRLVLRNRNANGDANNNLISAPAGSTINFMGTNRNNASSFSFRRNSTTVDVTTGSSAISYPPINGNMAIFARNTSPPSVYSNARIAFYSIGESLDLALLDARVTALVNAIDAAIP